MEAKNFQCPVQHVRRLEVITPDFTVRKKAEWMKSQQFFSDPPEKWGHKANHTFQNWSKRQTDTENHIILKRRPRSRGLYTNRHWMGKLSLYLIKCLMWARLRDKHSRESQFRGISTLFWVLPPRALPGSFGKIGKRSPLASGESSHLK